MLELQIKDLCVAFNGKEILHNITFDIENGAFIGIVGPSGAGKSTLLKQINRLDPSKTGGSILWRGKDVDDYDVHELRRNLAYVFQKAVMFDGTTEENIKLSLKYGNEFKPEEIEALYQTVLEEASISQDILDTPAQDLSGGQQQRVGIARALAVNPEFIVCDEPISALDVSIQSQVVNILEDMQHEMGLTYLFIAHDLSVVRHISHRIGVMYLGTMVELAESYELNRHPLHPYTKTLLSAVPVPDPQVSRSRQRIVLEGDIPSPMNPPSGCRFHTRCPYATEKCKQVVPTFKEYEKGHWVACHLLEE